MDGHAAGQTGEPGRPWGNNRPKGAFALQRAACGRFAAPPAAAASTREAKGGPTIGEQDDDPAGSRLRRRPFGRAAAADHPRLRRRDGMARLALCAAAAAGAAAQGDDGGAARRHHAPDRRICRHHGGGPRRDAVRPHPRDRHRAAALSPGPGRCFRASRIATGSTVPSSPSSTTIRAARRITPIRFGTIRRTCSASTCCDATTRWHTAPDEPGGRPRTAHRMTAGRKTGRQLWTPACPNIGGWSSCRASPP